MKEIKKDIEDKIILMLKDSESSMMAFRFVYGFMDGDVEDTLAYITELCIKNNLNIKNKFFNLMHDATEWRIYTNVVWIFPQGPDKALIYKYHGFNLMENIKKGIDKNDILHEEEVKSFFEKLLGVE